MKKNEVVWSKIPKKSGVYFFMGSRKEILYIGKATQLQSRIKSYFDQNIKEKRSLLIEKMILEAKKIEWVVTDSVLEAMLLETNLIRTHTPRYNTRSKDDKSYNHVVITNEEFPRVIVVRGKDMIHTSESDYLNVYGPYPSGTLFKEALKIIRKLFQFYDGAVHQHTHTSKLQKGKLDFNRQIGLYPQMCTKSEYAQTIKHIQLFFEGKKVQIIIDLEKKMHALARAEKFEEAQVIKKKIFSLKHIQDISMIKDESRLYIDTKRMRIEAYDVAHLQGSNMVGVMTVIEHEECARNEYRKFNITSTKTADDTKALREVLERRLVHREWRMPELIVVDGSTAQIRTAEKILKAHKLVIPVVGVVKDEHHKPLRIIGSQKLIEDHRPHILLANSEAHRFAITFHRTTRGKSFRG